MQTVSGPILIQRPVCRPDLQTKTPEDTNWMKSWRWIMRPVRLPFRKGWKPRSLLQYRNIIWTPITMLIIASISAWGADYLPEGFEIRQMRAEYKKQALLGDVFYPGSEAGSGKGYGCAFRGKWRTLCDCRVYVCMR